MKIRRRKIALLFHYFRLIGTNTNRIDLDEIKKKCGRHGIYIPYISIDRYPYIHMRKEKYRWVPPYSTSFFLSKTF